jgi:hypothetical protein
MNKKIRIVMNGAEDHNPATIPQTIKSHIIETVKNRLQLNSSDCLVDFVLWKVLNSVFTKRKKNKTNPPADIRK